MEAPKGKSHMKQILTYIAFSGDPVCNFVACRGTFDPPRRFAAGVLDASSPGDRLVFLPASTSMGWGTSPILYVDKPVEIELKEGPR